MNRSASTQLVFRIQRDGELFETLLGSASVATGVEVHGYCLMPNHFHLLVRCPDAGLSVFMQRISARFTRAVNQRRGDDGPVFRGRFHSIATEDTGYVDRALRYIHRNPLDIRDAGPIESYRWSSLRGYRDPTIAPSWLRTDVIGGLGDSVASEAPISVVELVRHIDLLIAAYLEAAPNEHRAIRRAVCLLLVDRGTARTRAAATELAAVGSADAARKARSRAAALITSSPEIGRLAEIVRELTA